MSCRDCAILAEAKGVCGNDGLPPEQPDGRCYLFCPKAEEPPSPPPVPTVEERLELVEAQIKVLAENIGIIYRYVRMIGSEVSIRVAPP